MMGEASVTKKLDYLKRPADGGGKTSKNARFNHGQTLSKFEPAPPGVYAFFSLL